MGPCPQLRFVALWSGAVTHWWSHPLAPASDLTVCCLILETFLPLSGAPPPLSGYRKTFASLQVFLPGGQCPPARLCPHILFIHSQALSQRAERMCSALVSPEAVAVMALSHPAPSTQHVVCRVGLRWVSTWTVWFHSARRKGSTAVLVMCLHVSVALIFTVLSLQPLPLGFQGSGCFFPLWPRWVASSPSSEQASSSRSCLLAVPFPYRHPPAHFSWQAHGFQNLLSDIFFSELFSGFV